VLAVEIDSIVPTFLKNKVKEIKNFEEVEQRIKHILKKPGIKFFSKFLQSC
jgi:hypothetical protein